MADSDVHEAIQLDADIDALVSPSVSELWRAMHGYPAEATGAVAAHRALAGGGSQPALAIVSTASASDSAVAPATPVLQPVPFESVMTDPDGLWNPATFAFDIAETGWYLCQVFLLEGGGAIVSDNCVVTGTIVVNGSGHNITQESGGYQLSSDPQAFTMNGWGGITHLRSGDSVEVDIATGSPTGTEETPSVVYVVQTAFSISMVRSGT